MVIRKKSTDEGAGAILGGGSMSNQQFAGAGSFAYAASYPPPGLAAGTGIRTPKVAIMVGNGSDGPMVRAIYTALLRDGAEPRLVGSRLGKIEANDKSVLYIETTLEDGPSYDALVVPDGAAAVASLAHDAHALDFVREQYRLRKPIMVLGAGAALLRQADVPPTYTGDETTALAPAIAAFKMALAAHSPGAV